MFSWDAAKALSNLKKHGVSFGDARTVFDDPMAIEWHDIEHSDMEYRAMRLGFSITGRLLVVAYAPRRLENGKEIIRIISARVASPKEREAYS